MTNKRSYSDNEKAEALAALDANGGNVTLTARQLTIPKQTLENWSNERGIHPAVTEMGTQKKEDLRASLESLAAKLVDRLTNGVDLASFKDASIALGIAVDKMQLLAGKPTVITEPQRLTPEERRRRIDELISKRGSGTTSTLGDDPADSEPIL